jgi:hypothetical protein
VPIRTIEREVKWDGRRRCPSAAARPQERPRDEAEERSTPSAAWLTTFLRRAGVALVASLAILPGVLAVFLTFFFLGEWPTQNGFDHVFYALAIGAGVWLVFSVVCLRGLADVQGGDSAAYDELVMRAETLHARLEGARQGPRGERHPPRSMSSR